MKTWKKIFLASIIVGIIGGIYGMYLYNKKPVDVRIEKANFDLTATDLVSSFNKDEGAANLKYNDKVISVKGKINSIAIDSTSASVILDGGNPSSTITCSFYDEEIKSVKALAKGSEITIKGKCTGIMKNELLEESDVILNKCSIQK